ncbi:hypothetical protein Tco_0679636 [Tanacetum coccineum]|uniref:Retrotransposon gag domain-containing protein n=1 Tax=Tanacetum coccineum TaxID=301880 RepID=A0ABQ4XII5_9ASTR
MNEGDGKINTWEELVKQFFSKFYPLSCASNYDKMCDDDEEGRDPLKFITWRNSKFKDHKEVDEIAKRALLYSWIEVGNNEGIIDEDISRNNDRDHTNLSMIAKPELKIGDEFLQILPDNSFNRMDGSDITDHIAKVLEITEWIKISNVDKDELRLHLFSKSLNGEAKKWWNSEGTIDDLVKYNEPCEESRKKTCSDLFFKPYLDAQDGKDVYEIIDRDYSPIPIPAHHDISNPDELCQTEEFTVVRNIMDEVDFEDLTIEQYFRMTQESHIPKKVDDMTIAEYLEYEETMKTQDYDEYQPHSAKVDVLTTYRDHLSPRHKSPDPPLDTKTNPYLQASQSPIHPKITKTISKYTREIKEQSNRGLSTDIAKISRKRSKPDKHGHGNEIDCARSGRMLSKSLTSQEAPIGQFPKENDMRGLKKAQSLYGLLLAYLQ